jgi:hypothetical protein
MTPAQIRKVADDSLPIDPFLLAEHSLRSPRSWKYKDPHDAIVCLPAAPMKFCIPIARETHTTSHTEEIEGQRLAHRLWGSPKFLCFRDAIER